MVDVGEVLDLGVSEALDGMQEPPVWESSLSWAKPC
jgi:hypothetical protein